MDCLKQTEHNEKSSQKRSYKRQYVLIAATLIIGVPLIGVALAAYFTLYVPQFQAAEYIAKSQPLFETIAKQVPVIKENTFLDRNTQYHSREDARDDVISDIGELEVILGDVEQAQIEIEQLALTEKIIPLNSELQSYLIEAERVISLNLEDQVFSKKIIDAYGDDLDPEINVYLEMYYSGGERTPFITQTKIVANLAEDALSRINNLELPENIDPFTYEIRIESLQDIRDTQLRLNEYYRLSQYDLVGPEAEAMTERTEARNEHGPDQTRNREARFHDRVPEIRAVLGSLLAARVGGSRRVAWASDSLPVSPIGGTRANKFAHATQRNPSPEPCRSPRVSGRCRRQVDRGTSLAMDVPSSTTRRTSSPSDLRSLSRFSQSLCCLPCACQAPVGSSVHASTTPTTSVSMSWIRRSMVCLTHTGVPGGN